MLRDSKVSARFYSQAISTAVHTQNKDLLRANTNREPYEICSGRSTNVMHFRIFGSKCYIMKYDGNIGKFDSKLDEGIFIGYSCETKAHK